MLQRGTTHCCPSGSPLLRYATSAAPTTIPSVLIRPKPGLQVAMPQYEAGRTSEPPVCVPIAPGHIPKATATADPLQHFEKTPVAATDIEHFRGLAAEKLEEHFGALFLYRFPSRTQELCSFSTCFDLGVVMRWIDDIEVSTPRPRVEIERRAAKTFEFLPRRCAI